MICSIHTPQSSSEAVINTGEMSLDEGMKDTISAVLDFIIETLHDRSARTLINPTVLVHEQGIILVL